MQSDCINLETGAMMTTTDAPILDGVHHVKLPVSDLDRTRAWYESRLGYRAAMQFTQGAQLSPGSRARCPGLRL